MACFGLFFLAGVGYFTGMKLGFDHADRSVTP